MATLPLTFDIVKVPWKGCERRMTTRRRGSITGCDSRAACVERRMEGWAAQKGSMSELILSYSSGKRTRWSSTYCHLRLTEPVGLSEKDKEEPLNDGPFVEPFRWVTAIASFVLCYGVLEVLARFAILGLPVLFCLLDELVHRVWTERVHVD